MYSCQMSTSTQFYYPVYLCTLLFVPLCLTYLFGRKKKWSKGKIFCVNSKYINCLHGQYPFDINASVIGLTKDWSDDQLCPVFSGFGTKKEK